MSVTYGFYNSLNGDRKYSTTQFSDMLDCLIVDGVFASIGTALVVKAGTGLTVNIGIGKAWFNHTWTLNDSILPMEAPEAEVLLDRIDALVLEVNSSTSMRANSFKFIKGNKGTSPVRPTLTDDGTVHQHALCYIYRKAGSTTIKQADITNVIGTKETPFVTGILKTVSLDELLGQWESELDQFISDKTAEMDTWSEQEKSDYYRWLANQKQYIETWSENEQSEFEDWRANEQEEFEAWFSNLEVQLSGNAAGHLQVQIDRIKREIKAKIAYITLYANKWVGDESYTQTVELEGIDAKTKIDLQPDITVFNQLFEDEVDAMYIENNEGVLTVYSINGKPSIDLTIQATVTDSELAGEVTYNEIENSYGGTTISITT